ncbi:TPA: hypothetical protein ACJFI9_000635 [Enterobacter roggenkampii]
MDVLGEFLSKTKNEIAESEPSFVVDFFRKEFDRLSEVVALYKKKKGRLNGTAYQNIASLAEQCGITRKDGTQLTITQVADYMRIVRAERKAEAKSAKAKAPVVVEPQRVVAQEPVARPGAVPGRASKTEAVSVPMPAVDCSGAIPEMIDGYNQMAELQKWDKLSNQDFWNDETETLYGQVRAWVVWGCGLADVDCSGKPILVIIKNHFSQETGFHKSLKETVEQLFKMREKHKGSVVWTL